MHNWLKSHPTLIAENQRASAILQRDWSALEELLADDLRYVHSTSTCHDKAGYISYLRSGPQFLTIDVDDSEVLADGDIAIVRGKLRMKIQKEEGVIQVSSWLTQVWRLVAGRWQLVLFQSTKDTA